MEQHARQNVHMLRKHMHKHKDVYVSFLLATPHISFTLNQQPAQCALQVQPLTAQTENARISYIEEIPPGKSKVAFTLVIAEEQARSGAVKIKGLKATGFPGKMLPGQGSGALNECDPDIAEILGCDEGSAVIR